MKILHLMLSNYYIDGASYQENILPLYNLQDGHEVKIIASTETFVNKTKLGYVKPTVYINEDGIEVARIPYRKILPHFIMKKIRIYPNLMRLIKEFNPDVVLHHGVTSFELLTLAKYKKQFTGMKLYLDCHETYENSARNLISRELLHRLYYGAVLRKALPQVDKILCTSTDNFAFLSDLYRVPPEKMEFYPLGGVLISFQELLERREKFRSELKIQPDEILMVHSGKLTKLKKTAELITAFSEIQNRTFKLHIIGEFDTRVANAITPLICNDHRIKFAGWLNREQILNYLCAADIYLQPGSRSVTMQQALCCGCAVMLYPHTGYNIYLKANGFFVKTKQDIIDVFHQINKNPEILTDMGLASYGLAQTMLDYRLLAKRLYS